jgi:hypothetical protein
VISAHGTFIFVLESEFSKIAQRFNAGYRSLITGKVPEGRQSCRYQKLMRPIRLIRLIHPDGRNNCRNNKTPKWSRFPSPPSPPSRPSRETLRKISRMIGDKNIKSPPNLSVEQGQMGNGSSSLSLSRTGIRRSPSRGLPVSRRYSPRQAEFRPRSRAVQRLSAAEFRVRLFSSLQLVVAPPACKPGQDTPAIFFRVFTAWLRVSHCF